MAPVSTNFIVRRGGGSGWRQRERTMEEDTAKAGAQGGPGAGPGPRPAACTNDTKRHKEMENVALQSSLNLGPRQGQEAEQEPSRPEPGPEPPEAGDGPEGDLELTQTDHLNKRLLTSFLEKINQPSFHFPNLQQPEDSNKMQEDW